MTIFQKRALSNPCARAAGIPSRTFHHIDGHWSIILTVNK